MFRFDAVFQANQHIFGSVPRRGPSYVCPRCLGPKKDYYWLCWGCERLHFQGAPEIPAVPMTTALNPSQWYIRLYTYKRGNTREYIPVIAGLARTYLDAHEDDIRQLLGGPPSITSVVPSKRGYDFEHQPLRIALSSVCPASYAPSELLRYVGEQRARRFEYFPQDYEVIPRFLYGERVLLIEDAWVTGSTAVSAAGAVLEAGAESVAIVSLARVIDKHYWREDHPCVRAACQPYDVHQWPR